MERVSLFYIAAAIPLVVYCSLAHGIIFGAKFEFLPLMLISFVLCSGSTWEVGLDFLPRTSQSDSVEIPICMHVNGIALELTLPGESLLGASSYTEHHPIICTKAPSNGETLRDCSKSVAVFGSSRNSDGAFRIFLMIYQIQR